MGPTRARRRVALDPTQNTNDGASTQRFTPIWRHIHSPFSPAGWRNGRCCHSRLHQHHHRGPGLLFPASSPAGGSTSWLARARCPLYSHVSHRLPASTTMTRARGRTVALPCAGAATRPGLDFFFAFRAGAPLACSASDTRARRGQRGPVVGCRAIGGQASKQQRRQPGSSEARWRTETRASRTSAVHHTGPPRARAPTPPSPSSVAGRWQRWRARSPSRPRARRAP